MARDGRTQAYLDAVGTQIRWRRARGPLLRELEDHIADQARDLASAGTERDEAVARAVAEMGDPVEVGRALDRLHRPKTSWGLLICALALMAAGLLAIPLFDEMPYTGRRQLLAACVAVPVMLTACFSDYRLLFRKKWIPGALAAGTFFALYLPYLLRGRFSYGASSTLTYAVLILPLLYAGALCLLRGRGVFTVLLCGCAAFILALPALSAPSFTAFLIAAATALFCLGAAVWRGWFGVKRLPGLAAAWGPAAALSLLFLPLQSQYANARLSIFLHPEQDPLGRGWFYGNVRALLRTLTFSGKLADGIGFRAGNDNDLFLFKLSASYGWCVLLAAALVILLFTVLVLRRIRRLSSTSGRLVAHAALWTLVFQGAAYLLFNLGWSPFGPIVFPLLSPGMVMLVVNAGLVGVLLSVFRMDSLARDQPAPACISL